MNEALLADGRQDELTASVTPRASLTAAERRELLDLLRIHFSGVTEEQFAADLEDKDWALRVRSGERLVGFSTLKVYASEFEGCRVNVVFSGDTIFDPVTWRSPILSREWIRLVKRLQRERGDEPWYWLLISSGWRTYRFLPVFWSEFFPRHGAETPPRIRRLLGHLATERFGDRFVREEGIVRLEHPQVLKDHLAEVPRGRIADPHVSFFLGRNPGHHRGDELVCLAELTDRNLTEAGHRMTRGLPR
jgi:hypothetical protein